MSASFVAPSSELTYTSMPYGPPPGLPVPQRLSPSPAMLNSGISIDGRNHSQGESFMSYIKGREVSVPSAVLSQCGISIIVNDPPRNLFPTPSIFVSPYTIAKN